MEILSGIFALLMFIFVIVALIGFIKPSIVKQETRLKAFGIYFGLALILMTASVITLPKIEETNGNSTKSQPENISKDQTKGQACEYEVIKADDYSFPGRKRVRWQILAPKATTFKDRAFTSIQAAKDLQKETEADQVNIWMEFHKELTGKGFPYAMVTYTPDGKGNSGEDINGEIWEVEASKDQINETQSKVAIEWYKNREKFRDKDKNLDEQKLKKYLSEILNLPEEQITLPWISKEKFAYKGGSYKMVGSKSSSSILNPESFSKSKCETNLSCWADKHEMDVLMKAPQLIQKFAKYDYEWTSGMLSPKFSHYRWKDANRGSITYIGDKIKLQNGFGAWQNYIYECDYDTKTGAILDIRMGVGRL